MDDPSLHPPGRVLADRYVLERQMGSGGAGVVWCAHDRMLDRTVAVKLLHGEVARDPVTAARFRGEAATAAKLTHPNAVVVHDIGHDGGDDYLVMEFVEGATLADVLRAGPLPPGVVAGLGAQVAAALGAAHDRQLVHRDVKPANVLVTLDGVAKVADFGIARAFGEAAARLTLPGHVMGTARYLAPEQLRDEPVDARADVYALGVLLHEALTGRIPFGTGTLAEVASRRLVASLPPVSKQRGDVPVLLDEAIRRATRLEPAERFADGAAFAAELARAATPDTAQVLAERAVDARGGDATGHLEDPTTQLPAGGRPGPREDAGEATRAIAPVGDRSTAGPEETVSHAVSRQADQRPASRSEPEPERRDGGPSRPRTPLLLVIVALAVVGVSLAVARLWSDDAGEGGAQDEPPAAIEDGSDGGEDVDEQTTGPIEVVASRDHDPFGSGEEHRDDVPNAFDDDPDTTWQTQGYRGTAALGGLKPGVGIWAELAAPAELAELVVELSAEGASFTVYAGDRPPDPDEAPADWGTAVAEVEDAATSSQLTFEEPVEAQVWLLWFTSLPPDGGEFRASVSEVEFVRV